jgi:hypothetical protein
MLGSNPSADSVASTDPGGCCASPFHLFAGKEPASGEASKRKILGARGKAPQAASAPKLPSKTGRSLIMRSLIMRALACWQQLRFLYKAFG